MDITVNQSFKKLLPPLSPDEYGALAESIVAEGCRESIIVWTPPPQTTFCKECDEDVDPQPGDGIWECPECGYGCDKMRSEVIDGHNRLEICTEHGIKYSVSEMDFADENEAMDWIDKNQIARRNLSPDDFRIAVGRRYNRTKRMDGGHGDQKSGGQNVRPNTAETIARDSGVTERTVRRAGKLAEAVENVQDEDPEIPWPDTVKAAKETLKPHVSHNSGNNEWYTPDMYIVSARKAMGEIDCDPASSDIANKTVKAGTYYTEQDDGLSKEWHGRVFLNPPYAQPIVRLFCEAVSDKYDGGEIEQAIVLVNNATETGFFQRMMKSASAICFPLGRIRFVDMDGNPSGAPLQGQAFLYFGSRVKSFVNSFSKHGEVMICKGE